MNKNKAIVVNTKLILTYFVNSICNFLNEDVKAEVIRKSKFNDSSVKEPIYILIEKFQRKVIPEFNLQKSDNIENEVKLKTQIIHFVLKKFTFPILSFYSKSYEQYTSRELLLILSWGFLCLNIFSNIQQKKLKKDKEGENDEVQNHHFIMHRYPPQDIAHHLFINTSEYNSHDMNKTDNNISQKSQNLDLKNKIQFILLKKQKLKYQLRSIHSLQQTRCKLFYHFQKQQLEFHPSVISPSSSFTVYYQNFIKKKIKNIPNTDLNQLKELLIASGLSSETPSHTRKLLVHSMNSFLYDIEPDLKDGTVQKLQEDIGIFDNLIENYTKEYYLWKWMSSVFNEYKKEQMNENLRINHHQLQNKKVTMMKLYQQIQQFKLFFKENILISFKTPLIDTVQPFTFQFQNNFLNESIGSKSSTLSFINNYILNINIPNNLNNLIDDVNNNKDNNNNNNNDSDNSNNHDHQINLNSSSSTSNLKINLVHPVYNTINISQPLTHNIYYQYLPIPSKYKSKFKSNSSLSNQPQQQHIPSLKLEESFHSTRQSTSSLSKKELQHSISLPNLVSSSLTATTTSNLSDHSNLKHNIVTMDSSSNNHLNSSDRDNHKKDEGEREEVEVEDEISLYSIKTAIEQDQQTLKKLQKKVSVLRKENQDLLDKILEKRKAKEQKNTSTKLNSKYLNILTLQQTKIIK